MAWVVPLVAALAPIAIEAIKGATSSDNNQNVSNASDQLTQAMRQAQGDIHSYRSRLRGQQLQGLQNRLGAFGGARDLLSSAMGNGPRLGGGPGGALGTNALSAPSLTGDLAGKSFAGMAGPNPGANILGLMGSLPPSMGGAQPPTANPNFAPTNMGPPTPSPSLPTAPPPSLNPAAPLPTANPAAFPQAGLPSLPKLPAGTLGLLSSMASAPPSTTPPPSLGGALPPLNPSSALLGATPR